MDVVLPRRRRTHLRWDTSLMLAAWMGLKRRLVAIALRPVSRKLPVKAIGSWPLLAAKKGQEARGWTTRMVTSTTILTRTRRASMVSSLFRSGLCNANAERSLTAAFAPLIPSFLF